ncbi:MAG: hypothetical protein IKV82_02870 [Akkermansia sp.]|nr:hypothetical protein [Akkermansia sp.]
MRYIPTILFLSSTMLMADTIAPWQSQAVQERHTAIHSIHNVCREVDEILLHLGINDTPDAASYENSSMPEGNPGETVAESDGGMLFDAANSRVTYINNVRVCDARVRLRCARRLYVQLPSSSLFSEKNATTTPEGKTPKQAPSDAMSTGNNDTAIPGVPVVSAPATMEVPVNDEPLDITTDEAVIDTQRNCILLTGHAKSSPGILIRQGQAEVSLDPTGKGDAPLIMADDNGDILLQSGKLNITWQDKEGNVSELQTDAETVYYRAAEHSLVVDGKARLVTPQGTLQFDKGAHITLEPKSPAGKEKDGFMSQFTNVRIAGILRAEAWGNVIATTPHSENRPAGEIQGEHLVHDAKAGTCLTEGKNCRLVYGKNTLMTDGSLRLEPNGDIYLSGSSITGSYERPATQENAPAICGTFHTKDTLHFSATDGTITAPHGISMKDDYSDFSCENSLILTLKKGTAARSVGKPGNLNLAIAQYNDISYARASGNVVLHHGDVAGQPETELRASEVELNLLTGEATLTAAGGSPVVLRSKGYELTAQSAQTPALVELASNGDIHITGEQINAALQDKENGTRIQARESLHLNRESGELALGPQSRITATDGILTANGALTAKLSKGAADRVQPLLPRFPHLVYNYNGLEKAFTSQGGTIQTAQASMQCKGVITVEMNPTPSAKDNSPTAAIKFASAEGSVALAGKDSTGRIMTATGDKLTLNGATGEKRLTGHKITLSDAYNIHTIQGAGASVVLDKKNNARISGARHTTTATRIPDQIEQQKKK